MSVVLCKLELLCDHRSWTEATDVISGAKFADKVKYV